jgi:hypothetical protein
MHLKSPIHLAAGTSEDRTDVAAVGIPVKRFNLGHVSPPITQQDTGGRNRNEVAHVNYLQSIKYAGHAGPPLICANSFLKPNTRYALAIVTPAADQFLVRCMQVPQMVA